MDAVALAQRLADEVLFPAALETDRADTLPVELLDALADAGLYGLTGPAPAGGLEAEFPTVCRVAERLSSGCLTTTFVWMQHLTCVMGATSTSNEEIRGWLPDLCSGALRGGLALGGAQRGTPSLRARRVDGGWSIDGVAPFVSGWGRIDVMRVAAATADGQLLWGFADARESASIAVARLDLVALNATATVRAEFRGHVIPDERVTSIDPFEEGFTPPPVLRMHATMPLGVAGRCAGLLAETSFDEQVAAVRAELDRLDPATIQAARAEAGELAMRAAAALMVEEGSRSLLRSGQAQRLAREALFCLAYALRPGSREAALRRLSADRIG